MNIRWPWVNIGWWRSTREWAKFREQGMSIIGSGQWHNMGDGTDAINALHTSAEQAMMMGGRGWAGGRQ